MRSIGNRSIPDTCRLPKLDENLNSPDDLDYSDILLLANSNTVQQSDSQTDSQSEDRSPLPPSCQPYMRSRSQTEESTSGYVTYGGLVDRADSAERLPLLSKDSRPSRSMFARQHDLIKLSPNLKAKAKAQAVRQKSLDHREKELSDATRDAMRLVENTIRTTQTVHKKDDEIKRLNEENSRLQQENQSLRLDLSNVSLDLHDAHFAIEDQRRQLASSHCRRVETRTEVDQAKLERLSLSNGVLNSRRLYEALMEDYNVLQEEMKTLSKQAHEIQKQNEELQRKNIQFNQHINSLEQALDLAEQPSTVPHSPCLNGKMRRIPGVQKSIDQTVDERSKSDLLFAIRRVIDDKMKWEAYACSLIRRILSRDPTILDCGKPNEMHHCCPSEARWETYATALLQRVLDKAPDILEAMQKPNVIRVDKFAKVCVV